MRHADSAAVGCGAHRLRLVRVHAAEGRSGACLVSVPTAKARMPSSVSVPRELRADGVLPESETQYIVTAFVPDNKAQA